MTGVLRFVGQAALAALVIAAAWHSLGILGAAGAVTVLASGVIAGYRGRSTRSAASPPSNPARRNHL